MSRSVPPIVGFAGRRLLRGIVTIWFAVTVTFLLVRLLPGDPALAVASPNMTPEVRTQLLHDYGLDEPLISQYGKYVWQLVHGNLGISFAPERKCHQGAERAAPVDPPAHGRRLARHGAPGHSTRGGCCQPARRAVDRGAQIFSVACGSLFVPSAGILLLFVFGLKLGWLPIGGAYDNETYGGAWYVSVLTHLLLPVFSLVLVQIGAYVLTLRSTLITALREDYADLARSKGAMERRVVWKHGVRNAMLPVTTLMGLQLGHLVGGAVLTETIFAYPGVDAASSPP